MKRNSIFDQLEANENKTQSKNQNVSSEIGFAPIMVMGSVPFWLWMPVAFPLVISALVYAWGGTGSLIYEGFHYSSTGWEALLGIAVCIPASAALTFFAVVFFLRYVKRCKQWRYSNYFIEEKWHFQKILRVTDGKLFGIFNTNLRKIMLPIEYQKITQVAPKTFIIEKDGKKGIFWKRKIVAPVRFDTLNWDEQNHRFDIVINGNLYHFDERGKIQYLK